MVVVVEVDLDVGPPHLHRNLATTVSLSPHSPATTTATPTTTDASAQTPTSTSDIPHQRPIPIAPSEHALAPLPRFLHHPNPGSTSMAACVRFYDEDSFLEPTSASVSSSPQRPPHRGVQNTCLAQTHEHTWQGAECMSTPIAM